MYQVSKINAFRDNYIWALVKNDRVAIVDPGEAQPVLDFININQLQLTDILITHHHPDHIGGIQTLIEQFPNVEVYGPATERFPMVTVPCTDNLNIETKLGAQLTVIELPGHTIDHICYIDEFHAFVGDTLFSGGCGRLFEGTPEQMMGSLSRLAQLPEETHVYCAHEYTQANLEFAIKVEANNLQLTDYIDEVNSKRTHLEATIPTTIGTELAINPFLRSAKNEIKQSLMQHYELNKQPNDLESFTLLRKWKDNF